MPTRNTLQETRSNVTVNVVASLNAPSGMAATFPSTTVNRFMWPAVNSADHYKIRTDFVPTGVFSPSCTGNIAGTQYDAAVPGSQYHLIPWYRRVLACTSAGLCSPLSAAFTVSERFNSGAWNYVFTLYRSVDDVNLQFINFNPGPMALQLHIRNGDASDSPSVTDSACISPGAVGSVGPMSAYYSFSNNRLATQPHDVESEAACAPTHSTTVGWGFIPPQSGPCCATPTPTPSPTPVAVGGVTELPGIDRGGGPGDAAFVGVAAAVALLLGAGALYARRR